MRIIDNVNELLGDDLKSEMGKGSKLRIAATTFSIFAFESLKKELEGLGELDFIFTSPTFVAETSAQRPPKARRQFFIPNVQRRIGTIRVGVRDSATQQDDSTGNRPRVRRVGSQQGPVPV